MVMASPRVTAVFGGISARALAQVVELMMPEPWSGYRVARWPCASWITRARR